MARQVEIPYLRIRILGWLCVRCGAGRYIAGACSACGLHVPSFARMPWQLIKPAFRRSAA